MNMIEYCKQNLIEIRFLLEKLPEGAYQKPSEILSGASIGQHVRHILEFYICLLRGAGASRVSYDNRVRNTEIETNTSVAMGSIDDILKKLSGIVRDHPVVLEGNYTESSTGADCHIPSSLYRELAYNLEHSIHHQALIKVGLKELGIEALLNEHFGVAPATVRFIKENRTTYEG